MENRKYYVTMTDKFMSGWGRASGRINKLVFECDSYYEACTVAENANNRSDMKYVNITSKKPYYSSARYYAQYKNKEECPAWYKEGYFKSA
ncbi:hypothetical protein ABE137_12540 [Brevibacillus laterosporus]|uniref:hypothetical protein n=1 Tax=Brevibacillus phage Sundance TaxID=1691958 RepID=UPI0006BC649C|nr:hypothetical protein AVT09_gp191 [Brevibacillus phage Sundance]ALA48007.1 hypothetical protein SUNDANCE_191 [Brevibacillus phage Sundance]